MYGNFLGSTRRFKITKIINTDHRRWARYFAKNMDVALIGLPIVFLFTFVMGFVIGLIFPAWALDPATAWQVNLLFSVLAIVFAAALYPIVEAMLISSYATTPGKALMGFRVTLQNDEKLPKLTSLARSYQSYFFGLGAGIPIVALFAMLIQYTRVGDTGATSWDERMNLVVHTKQVGAIRWLFGLFFGFILPTILAVIDRILAMSQY